MPLPESNSTGYAPGNGPTPTKPEQQVPKSTAAHYPRSSMQQP